MNIVQFSIALLHTEPAFTAFQDKGCMHLHPKNHVHVKCIDGRPSQRVNIFLSHKVKAIWYLYLLVRFIRLKVLTLED